MGHKHKKDKKKKHHHHHSSESSDSDKSDNYGLFSDSENEDIDAFIAEIDGGVKKIDKKSTAPSPLHSTVQPPKEERRVSELLRSLDRLTTPKPPEDPTSNSSHTSTSSDKDKEKVDKHKHKDKKSTNQTPSEVLYNLEDDDDEEELIVDKHKHKHKHKNKNSSEKLFNLEDDDNNNEVNKQKEKHKHKHKKSSKDKPSEPLFNLENDDDEVNKEKDKKASNLTPSEVLHNLEKEEEIEVGKDKQKQQKSSTSSSNTPPPQQHPLDKEEEEEEVKDKNSFEVDVNFSASSSTSSSSNTKPIQQQQQLPLPNNETQPTVQIPSARKRPQSARHYQNIHPNNNNQQQQQPIPEQQDKDKSISNKSSFSNPSFSSSSSQYEDIPLVGHTNNNNRSNSVHSNGSKSIKESENLTFPENKAEILQSNPALNSELQKPQLQPQPPINSETSSRRPVSFHKSVLSENSVNSVKELSSKNENLIQRAYESERTNQISSLRSMETVNPMIQTTLNDKTKWKFDIFRKKLEMSNNNNMDDENDEDENNKMNNICAPLKQTSEKKNIYYDKVSKPQIRIPPRGTVAYVHYMKSIKCTCPPKLKSICTIDHPCNGCARSIALYGMNIEREGCSYNPKITHNIQMNGGNDNPGNFIQRQDNNIKMAIKEQIKRSGVAKYESGIIKECPVCKSKQSYEQFISGHIKCNNCNKNFQFPRGWNDVKKEFWKRNDEFIRKKKDKRVVERDIYDYKYGVTYYCRICKKCQSLNEYMNHQMKCSLGHPYIPQYSNYEINDDEEEGVEEVRS